jgi:hypothetical protein
MHTFPQICSGPKPSAGQAPWKSCVQPGDPDDDEEDDELPGAGSGGTQTRVTPLQRNVPRSVVPAGQGSSNGYVVPSGRLPSVQNWSPLEH